MESDQRGLQREGSESSGDRLNPLDIDVVVIGARVAGTTLAALLGERGHRVLVLDKAVFPSDTLSTHFFRGGGFAGVLDTLGLLEPVLAAGSPPLRTQMTYRGGSSAGEEFPVPGAGNVDFALSVRRSTLDHMLVERARRSPSVVVEEGARVVALVRDGDRVSGVRYRSAAGEEHDVRARFVVGADGRRSVVARAVEPTIQQLVEPLRALYYRYVSGWTGPDGSTPAHAEFSFFDDEIAYVFPSDGGITCLALSINRSLFDSFRSDARARFDERLRAHAAYAERYDACAPDGFFGSHPEESWVRAPVGDGWALVGDAGLHLDPWTGLGMDNAGTHAAFLAEALDEVLSGRGSEPDALARFHQRRDNASLQGFADTARYARDLRPLSAS